MVGGGVVFGLRRRRVRVPYGFGVSRVLVRFWPVKWLSVS